MRHGKSGGKDLNLKLVRTPDGAIKPIKSLLPVKDLNIRIVYQNKMKAVKR